MLAMLLCRFNFLNDKRVEIKNSKRMINPIYKGKNPISISLVPVSVLYNPKGLSRKTLSLELNSKIFIPDKTRETRTMDMKR